MTLLSFSIINLDTNLDVGITSEQEILYVSFDLWINGVRYHHGV